MGPISFSRGSLRFTGGRDLAISDESEESLAAELEGEGYEHVEEPFALGDVSFHLGWTYHRAGSNLTDRPRRAFTIIYLEDGARLIEPRRPEHEADRDAFIAGREPGELVDTELNPLLYP